MDTKRTTIVHDHSSSAKDVRVGDELGLPHTYRYMNVEHIHLLHNGMDVLFVGKVQANPSYRDSVEMRIDAPVVRKYVVIK